MLTFDTGVWLVQHMESLKIEVEKLRSEAKHSSSGRMLDEVEKYRKANGALHATIARLEAGVYVPLLQHVLHQTDTKGPQ